MSGAARVRISQFTVQGVANDTLNNNRGYILFGAGTRDLRVDNVTFRDQKTPGIIIWNSGTGVIDHCVFDSGGERGINVYFGTWNGGEYGDTSWTGPSSMGTAEAIFVEDCVFNSTYISLSAGIGARLVVRNSTFNNGAVYVSGLDSSGRFRSARHVEIYANRFIRSAPGANAIVFGGGTGVVTNNSFEGPYSSLVDLENLRSMGISAGPFGQCTGTNPFDQNSDGGYACLAQVGRGEGTLFSGSPPMPQAWPMQVSDPLYVWGNSTDAGVPFVMNKTPSVLALNRDWIESSPRPRYTTFVYPHPLVTRTDAGSDMPAMTSWKVGCGCYSTPTFTGIVLLLLVALRSRGFPQFKK